MAHGGNAPMVAGRQAEGTRGGGRRTETSSETWAVRGGAGGFFAGAQVGVDV